MTVRVSAWRVVAASIGLLLIVVMVLSPANGSASTKHEGLHASDPRGMYVISADGSHRRVFVRDPALGVTFALSPNGRELAFARATLGPMRFG